MSRMGSRPVLGYGTCLRGSDGESALTPALSHGERGRPDLPQSAGPPVEERVCRKSHSPSVNHIINAEPSVCLQGDRKLIGQRPTGPFG